MERVDIIYINDLPPTINSQSKLILFADDTNIIISHPEIDCFQICMNDIFADLSKRIKASKLTLNFDKINFMKFYSTNKNRVNLSIGYEDKTIEEVETTKFFALQIDNNLNWKTKLSMLCYEDCHITHENRKFKISLLCLLPFNHVTWNYFLGKLNRQQKSILHSK
jgi:hypothetical protein